MLECSGSVSASVNANLLTTVGSTLTWNLALSARYFLNVIGPRVFKMFAPRIWPVALRLELVLELPRIWPVASPTTDYAQSRDIVGIVVSVNPDHAQNRTPTIKVPRSARLLYGKQTKTRVIWFVKTFEVV